MSDQTSNDCSISDDVTCAKNEKMEKVIEHVKSSEDFEKSNLRKILFGPFYIPFQTPDETVVYDSNAPCVLCERTDEGLKRVYANFRHCDRAMEAICQAKVTSKLADIIADIQVTEGRTELTKEELDEANKKYADFVEHDLDPYGNGRHASICSECCDSCAFTVKKCYACSVCIVAEKDRPDEVFKTVPVFGVQRNFCQYCAELFRRNCPKCGFRKQGGGFDISDTDNPRMNKLGLKVGNLGSFCTECSTEGTIEEIAESLEDLNTLNHVDPKWMSTYPFVDIECKQTDEKGLPIVAGIKRPRDEDETAQVLEKKPNTE